MTHEWKSSPETLAHLRKELGKVRKRVFGDLTRNPLEIQNERAAVNAADFPAESLAIVKRWARHNGLTWTPHAFLPEDIAARKARPRHRTCQWPGVDHPTHYRRDGFPVALVAEPYDGEDIAKLHVNAARLGLLMSSPPNPWASAWYPGATRFIVLHLPDFAPRWLPEQLRYRGSPPSATR